MHIRFAFWKHLCINTMGCQWTIGRYPVVDNHIDGSASKILGIVKEHPNGLSITDLAVLLSINRNSVAKYLGIFQRQGLVDMRRVGAAKIFYPTRRLPVAAVRRFCSSNLIVVDHNLKILEVSDALAGPIGMTPAALSDQPISALFPCISSSGEVISPLRKALWGEEGILLQRPGRDRGTGSTCRFSLIPTVLDSGHPAVSLVLEEDSAGDEHEEERLLDALRHEALQSDQTEGIVNVSPDGRIRRASSAYCRTTGKSIRDDLVGKPFQPPVAATDSRAWKEFVRNLTPDNPTATIDCRMVVSDEGVRWYRWRGRILCGPDGRAIEYQYLCSSIHEHKILEESLFRQQRALEQQVSDRTAALRESEEKFRAIFEESPAGTALCNMDGTLLHVNKAFLATLSTGKRQELEGRNVFEYLNISPAMRSRLQGGKAARFIIPYSRNEHRNRSCCTAEESETICLKGVASPVSCRKNGVSSTFVLQLQDITGQRRAEAGTSEAESRYRHLLDTLAEGVVYLGTDGRIIDASPSAERILGYSLPELQRKTCSELQRRVIGEDGFEHPEEPLPHMAALASGGSERKILGIFNPREGQHRWIDILAVPRFRHGEDRPFQVAAVFSDITRLREIEEARLDTERQYLALTESLPDVALLIDPDGHPVYVNSLGARLMHRLPEDVLGRKLTDLFPGDQGENYCRDVASVAATCTIKNNVSRLPLPDGEVWYDTRLIPISARDGTCRYVMGIARDITAWKQAEDVSRRHAEWFRSIFEESPIGIAVCDRDWALLHVNRACLGLFGVTRPDEIPGTSLLQICRTFGNFNLLPPGDAATSFECRLDFDAVRGRDLLPTTRTGSVHVRGVIGRLGSPDSGSPEGYLIQMLDITSRVLAERVLRESHERLAGIARHLPDAMFAIDRQGIVTIWNPAMEELTGIPAVEMLGKGDYEYALPFYGKRVPLLVDKILKPDETLYNRYRTITFVEGNSIIAETAITHEDDDSPRIWWVKAALLYDEHEESTGAIELIRDITAQRRAEEALKRVRFSPNTTFETL